VILLNLPPIADCCHGSSPCYLSPPCGAALGRVAGAETRCIVFRSAQFWLVVGGNSLIRLNFMEQNRFGFRSILLGFPSAWGWNSFSLVLEFLQPSLEFVPGGLGRPTPARHPVQSSTILPQSPRRIVSKPSMNRLAGRRWVMTLRTLSPLSSMAIILCQVSNISRP
jgi:hypothetical protein